MVHFARRAAAAFPDGQLFVNLRGFDPVTRRWAQGMRWPGSYTRWPRPLGSACRSPDELTTMYRSL